jgi:cell fate (sporulation/competence/biofilm development) regulator YmcA (YheA/YmcA/DUF963 family)
LFDSPPVFDFFPEEEFCRNDNNRLKVLKTDARKIKTILIGSFKAHETIRVCPRCGMQYRSKELSRIVPPGCNIGYDILVYVGRALFLTHLPDHTIVEQLAVQNVHISASEIAYLGKKFIAYLTIAHRKSAPRIKSAMDLKGGYILHLDATYEDKSPLLMSGLDSIMKIVLCNCKLLSEKSDGIVPFLEDIENLFGEPLALVHDMSKGIIKAVGKVFPDTLDFICHFHFLRDIGKDLLEAEYANIRKILTKHGIAGKLNCRLRKFKQDVDKNDKNAKLIDMLNLQSSSVCDAFFTFMPMIAAYSLIIWALKGKKQGNGYGFPFDRPHLEFAKRLKVAHTDLDQLRKIKLRHGHHRDNKPLHKAFFDLSDVMKDRSLWKSVDRIESEIEIFEKLRDAMRIAPKTSKKGLNSGGASVRIRTIEKDLKKFRKKIIGTKGYDKNERHKKMIEQIDRYWEKLFADPIEVETCDGKKHIQPQRTNNFAEQGFRELKRGYRKKTGNGSLGKTLRTMLANTPLVKNLKNSEYMQILLDGQSSLEDLFAKIDATEVRNELQAAEGNIEKIPAKLKKLTNKSDYPEMLKNYFFGLKSNGILC